MKQRVMQLMGPLGRGRRALSRLLRRRTEAVAARPPHAQIVSCPMELTPDGDAAVPAARSQALLRQGWRPLEVLVAGPSDAMGRVPRITGVRRLVYDGERPPDLAAHLRRLAGDFELLVAGEAVAAPGHLPGLVAALRADPTRDFVARDGWHLRRNPPLPERAAAMRLLDAAALDPGDAMPCSDGQPLVLRFDDDPDRPYRFRAWLAEPFVFALTADATTAERLALLTPRSVLDESEQRGLRRLGALPAVLPARLHAMRPRKPEHVVLQADDYTEGGMEQVVIDLAEALQAAGFTVSLLILGKEGTAAQRARDRGLVVDNLKPEADAYLDYLRTHDVALVNAHYSTFGAELCARLGVPFVQTVHNMYMWFGPPQVAAYRKADPHTRAYVCVSNNVARYADLTIGLSPSRMLVIPNGCDQGFRPEPAHRAAAAELRRELALGDDARVFLNVGSVQPPKAQHLLLSAFEHIARDCPAAHLVFLGGAADALYLEAQQQRTRQLGLEGRVHWVGRRADVHAFHQLAVALVQPSFFEGWSLAITEAVLAELPVIATDVGGAVEQLRGTDGILLPAAVDDITAIDADRLMPMLAGSYPELEQRIAAAMREVLARDAARSRMPDDWRGLLRDAAYRRCAEVFHWLAGGGSAAAARYWLRPAGAGATTAAGDLAGGAEAEA